MIFYRASTVDGARYRWPGVRQTEPITVFIAVRFIVFGPRPLPPRRANNAIVAAPNDPPLPPPPPPNHVPFARTAYTRVITFGRRAIAVRTPRTVPALGGTRNRPERGSGLPSPPPLPSGSTFKKKKKVLNKVFVKNLFLADTI